MRKPGRPKWMECAITVRINVALTSLVLIYAKNVGKEMSLFIYPKNV